MPRGGGRGWQGSARRRSSSSPPACGRTCWRKTPARPLCSAGCPAPAYATAPPGRAPPRSSRRRGRSGRCRSRRQRVARDDAPAAEMALEHLEGRHMGRIEQPARLIGPFEGQDPRQHHVGERDLRAVVPAALQDSRPRSAPRCGCAPSCPCGCFSPTVTKRPLGAVPVDPGIGRHRDLGRALQGQPVVGAADRDIVDDRDLGGAMRCGQYRPVNGSGSSSVSLSARMTRVSNSQLLPATGSTARSARWARRTRCCRRPGRGTGWCRATATSRPRRRRGRRPARHSRARPDVELIHHPHAHRVSIASSSARAIISWRSSQVA
jgi:hypothetical protein